MTRDHGGLNRALEGMVTAKLARFNGRAVTAATCMELYATIFGSFVELFSASGAPLGNEAVNFIAQAYYDGVKVNGRQELDPGIFTQRASLEAVPTPELVTMAALFGRSEIGSAAAAEVKRRS